MKRLKATAQIVKISAITNPDGSPVYRNDRLRSHRIILAPSPSFEKALAECETLERADGQKKYFCLKRDDGMYAMDLTPQQVQLLTAGRVNVPTLQIIAASCSFAVVVELRQPGDSFINRRTKEEGVVGENGFAAIQDMTANIPAHVLDRILQYTINATINQPAPAFAPVASAAPVAETLDANNGDESHVEAEDEITGASGAAPMADARPRTGTTAKQQPAKVK